MFLVTGATGTVGRQVVHHLLRSGAKVRALTRDPAAAGLPEDVEVVGGDISDTTTLAAAFDGVTAVHLITFGGGYRPLANGPELVALAERSGVRRVTVLSGFSEGTVEPAVRAGSLEWTLLAPGEFMANTLTDWGRPLREHGVVREPFGDRRSAPVDEYDIGAVAAVALTDGGHGGQHYPLTGPSALTPRDKIRILAAATGRDLRFEELTPDEARREWATTPPDLLIMDVLRQIPGIDDTQAFEQLLQLYGTNFEAAYTVTDSVERVTGRPARPFATWAAEHADAFLG